MDSDKEAVARLERYLAETCPECGTPGPQRHLSRVAGCPTCMDLDPRPVYIPQRLKPQGWRVSGQQP